jgi:hypothetical protein
MTASDLPHLTITGIGMDCCAGHYDSSPWIGEGWIGCLYLGAGHFVWGRFRDVNATERICAFYPDQAAEMVELKPGTRYPFLDGYWGERAQLVLKEGQHWERLHFQPSDMIRFSVDGGGWMGARYSEDSPVGGDVVTGGWDHEHCGICWKKIGYDGEPNGFFSKPDKWVCEECYTSFVTPRSIAFIVQD